MIIWLYGLFSWLLVGAVAGVAAALTLPAPAKPGKAAGLLVGAFGATLGGLAATLLGFGGLASFDVRSLAAAALAALATVVWWRVASLTSRAA
ncbi:MAG: hypothetical protein AAGF23_14435 [Acidobacteriota bacterium]